MMPSIGVTLGRQIQPLELHGIVLAGGGSTRMGSDKALLRVHDGTLLELVCANLGKLCRSVTVVTPAEEPDRYAGILPASYCVVPDVYPGEGPLAGLHAGLRSIVPSAGTDAYGFVIACDMPFISRCLFERMSTALERERPDAVICPGQFFHAMYRVQLHDQAESTLKRGERRFGRFLETLRTIYIEPAEEELDAFVNLNTPGDYEAFLQRIKS